MVDRKKCQMECCDAQYYSAVDNEVIEFEETQYEVAEDIGLNHYALRVCLNISNLRYERNVTFSTLPMTARGMQMKHIFFLSSYLKQTILLQVERIL